MLMCSMLQVESKEVVNRMEEVVNRMEDLAIDVEWKVCWIVREGDETSRRHQPGGEFALAPYLHHVSSLASYAPPSL